METQGAEELRCLDMKCVITVRNADQKNQILPVSDVYLEDRISRLENSEVVTWNVKSASLKISQPGATPPDKP